MIFTDFLLDDDGDLFIDSVTGDFVVGPSDNQHIDDIITSFAGAFKQYPILGCGLLTYLKSQDGQAAVNEIKQQLQSDGYQLAKVEVSNIGGKLQVTFPLGITR
jgi:hypothetical protein